MQTSDAECIERRGSSPEAQADERRGTKTLLQSGDPMGLAFPQSERARSSHGGKDISIDTESGGRALKLHGEVQGLAPFVAKFQ